jgi:hypothetical protein
MVATMKRLCTSLALAALITLLLVVPVVAAYYAYIYVEESNGNSYEELPLICSTNVSQLAQYNFITSTGLTSRVLTGSGGVLPHMLANDKILFVTDLAAYEDKTLIFYPKGATSLSSFPIIVGYNGSFETPDDPDLELGYVMELLISGYFNADAEDVGHNILYKEDAFRVWISAADTLKVAAYNSTGDEQWYLQDSSFGSGVHTVYIVCNGLFALLYVDTFDVAVDTTSLYTNVNWQLASQTDTGLSPMTRRTVYAEGRYWAFWLENSVSDHIYYSSSIDGAAWETVADINVADVYSTDRIAIAFDGTYVHIVAACTGWTGVVYYPKIYYFRGELVGDGTINWDAQDDIVTFTYDTEYLCGFSINVDVNGYPYVMYGWTYNGIYVPPYHSYVTVAKSSTNNGTWTTAGGYPQNLDDTTTNPYYNDYHNCYLAEFQGTTHLYALYSDDGSHSSSNQYVLAGKYFNGSSWAGSPDTIFDGYSTGETVQHFDAVCDDDGNMFIVWRTSASNVYMRVRYADTSWGVITLVATSAKQPSVSYSPVSHCVYVVFISGDYVYGVSIIGGAVSHAGVIFTPVTTTGATMCNSGYSTYSGILYCTSGQVQHGMVGFYWTWNDNDNDWYWMQNNVMPYADDVWMSIDGTEELQYEPEGIIQNSALPDETEQDHDGTINWGTNPDGVDVSISGLQTDEQQGVSYYPYTAPGNTNIIEPEPATMTSDIDTAKLAKNPLSLLFQAISNPTGGQLPFRLLWLGFAILVLIVSMGYVQFKTEHITFTSLTGLGVSVMFYVLGVFPLWVIILLAIGLIASIIAERQPVL